MQDQSLVIASYGQCNAYWGVMVAGARPIPRLILTMMNDKLAWKLVFVLFIHGIHACDHIAVFDKSFLLLRGLQN